MAQTISELEKERAELLKAIESQAQQMSSTRSADATQQNAHSLSDWLNAAEEVMPSTSNPSNQNPSGNKETNLKSKPVTNKSSFFGVIILLTLLLTILGVLYIAYTTINKELQEVIAVKENGMAETERLQKSMDELQQSLATGGKPEAFTALEKRVMDLEAQLSAIQQQQQALLARLESAPVSAVELSRVDGAASVDSAATSASPVQSGKVVTEAVLEEKLKTYTSQLEKRIDQKLEMILERLSQSGNEVKSIDSTLKDEVLIEKPQDQKGGAIQAQQVAQPVEPIAPKVSTPLVKQPIVKLVEEIAKPEAVELETQSLKAYSPDEKWLQQQPEQHYVLQLASMSDKQALLSMVKQKALSDTRIVEQVRNESRRYVLLTGSYASRADANNRAKAVKAEYGISAWVRKFKDLTSKLP
ncbi:MAG: SPOR domain-containing protein [Thiomicrorhabdus chilensis]|uniref:SPOR domain-containing protein n=1 Tax=Thiomicrorhabdus chilensis TaxID=63656 RepID=UPI00299D6CF2|nr:SPOR domain-containing protein [Thiomicrorhabdus chilensis]MDX1348177.1 SPOR domain-containing protein [Thiomicrorhabdus chilensis]